MWIFVRRELMRFAPGLQMDYNDGVSQAFNMVMIRWITLFFFTPFLCLSGKAQTSELLQSIAFHADVMVNADRDIHRMKAHGAFTAAMDSFLILPNAFEISLDSIPWISVLKDPGFRIVTWQLREAEDKYSYGGFIQYPDRVIRLVDNRPWLNGSLRNFYSPSSWYGALYYRMIPYDAGRFILFGFHAEDNKINTKVAEVLDLTGTEPKLGAPVFIGKDEPQTRLILNYADVSSVQLEFDPEINAIVHDHLITLQGVGIDGEALPVSDGSYEGWLLTEGKWQYKEKVYDVIVNTPPMTEERKERKENKDILGRPRNP